MLDGRFFKWIKAIGIERWFYQTSRLNAMDFSKKNAHVVS